MREESSRTSSPKTLVSISSRSSWSSAADLQVGVHDCVGDGVEHGGRPVREDLRPLLEPLAHRGELLAGPVPDGEDEVLPDEDGDLAGLDLGRRPCRT